MKILVFKTDINTKRNVRAVRPVLSSHPVIKDWSVDTQDIDKVLRIVAVESIDDREIMDMIVQAGFQCEVLKD